jgi:hypothetical protein
MRSINRRFKNYQESNPSSGDYVNLYNTVAGQKFSQRTIARAFHELIPKDDYSKEDIKPLINHLFRKSQT